MDLLNFDGAYYIQSFVKENRDWEYKITVNFPNSQRSFITDTLDGITEQVEKFKRDNNFKDAVNNILNEE